LEQLVYGHISAENRENQSRNWEIRNESMSDAIISVEGLGKKYRISHQGERQRYVALRDVIAEKAKSVVQKLKSLKAEKLKPENISGFQDFSVSEFKKDVSVSAFQNVSVSGTEDFWALKDVSFEVKRGEVVGIIGRNGAGKSTLLKILSRITEPTEGRVTLRGRVASLLEVGTGFHPELTGRENVFLNGAILGMSRAEIRKKFDEIVAFAEVEKFLDTPVKRYSSGMYVRLAFAVAAHLEPEILIVDEVLAVGDAEFQKKCMGKMQDVSRGGRTVLFVSHNTGAVAKLCSKAIHLERGVVKNIGSATNVLQLYLTNSAKNRSDFELDFHRVAKTKSTRINAISISCKNGSQLYWGEQLRLTLAVETQDKIEGLFFGVTVVNRKGEAVGSCLLGQRFALKTGEKANFVLIIESDALTPETYTLNVGLGRGGQQEILDAVVGYPTFEVMPTSESGSGIEVWDSSWGNIFFKVVQFERTSL
jgi:lipopolysaccharide transport system ATP-binding protein